MNNLETYLTFWKRERRGVFREKLWFCGSGAAGATVNLKEAFVMDQKPAKAEGQVLGMQELLLPGLVSECDAHNRHRGHQDLVYRIVTPEAARLALLCFNIRKRKSFQPFLALQDPVPASFVSSQFWSGSCNGTQVSNVHPVSMETGRLYQSDGHAPQWLDWGMAQKVETRCYTLKGKLGPGKKKKEVDSKKGNYLG